MLLGEALAQTGTPGVLIFANETTEVQKASIIALGELGSRKATLPLLEFLDSENMDLVRFSAEALGKLGDERAIEQVRLHWQHRGTRHRRHGGLGPGRCGGPPASTAAAPSRATPPASTPAKPTRPCATNSKPTPKNSPTRSRSSRSTRSTPLRPTT